MKEIGGYIELDSYTGSMLHEDGIKLNCGRNAFAYLVIAKEIKKIWMPKFMCDSCNDILVQNNIHVNYYNVGMNFKPLHLSREEDEWLYLVNYYGQCTNAYIQSLGKNVIVDNAQAYFQQPMKGVDTLYTCRKFFGVTDGAILYTNRIIDVEEQDESYSRMKYILGRYERDASEFYSEYVSNNNMFVNEPIKRMSKLTKNLLHGIDYQFVEKRRTENFTFLHNRFCNVNKLSLNVPKGAFMYPLYIENGDEIRKELIKKKIYIPILWPNVFDVCSEKEEEYGMAKNILPLPVDQRYTIVDMAWLVEEVEKCLESFC